MQLITNDNEILLALNNILITLTEPNKVYI